MEAYSGYRRPSQKRIGRRSCRFRCIHGDWILPTSLVIPFFFAYMGHRLIGRNERSDVAVPNPPVEDFTSKELLDCDRLEAAPLLCTCVVDAQCEARLIKAARSESAVTLPVLHAGPSLPLFSSLRLPQTASRLSCGTLRVLPFRRH